MHIDTPVKRLAPTPAAALVHEAALRAAYLAEMAAQRGAAAQRDATALTATAAEQTRSPDALSLGQVPLIKPANWASMSHFGQLSRPSENFRAILDNIQDLGYQLSRPIDNEKSQFRQ
jgi:hypothetical protein